MEEKSVKKCRTCLRNRTTTLPLNDLFIGAKAKSTYAQMLKECARLEYSSECEHLMPQNLCTLCCQELSKAYTFIQKAQYCNNKLINLLAQKLQNVKSENEQFEIDIHQNISTEVNSQDEARNNFRIANTDEIKSEIVKLEEKNEYAQIQLKNKKEETDDCNSSDSCNKSKACKNQTTCPICQKKLNGHNSLKNHIRMEHDIKAYNKSVKKPVIINKKRRKTCNQKKTKEREFKCSSCNYKARTYGAMDLHKRSKHGNEDDKFKCNFCPYTSWVKFMLYVHVKKLHKNEIKDLKTAAENNMNPRCIGDTYADTDGLNNKNDTKSETQTVINSPTSRTTYDDGKEGLTDTEDQEKEELSYTNDSNDQDEDDLFIRKMLNVKKRQSQSVSTNLLARRCDECGNIYNNIQALKTHKKNVHISEEQYISCPHCVKKFKKLGNMRMHVQRVHNPTLKKTRKKASQTKERNLMCSQCSYVCCNKSLLANHINRHHTGEKPYKCEVCNKSFVVAFDLKIHRYIHTGEKPYKCSFCSKGFRCSKDLVKHTRIHTNERPYKCQECDKTFIQSSNLKLHKRVHIKAKNLKCTVCNKFFENQNLLNTHRITDEHYEEA